MGDLYESLQDGIFFFFYPDVEIWGQILGPMPPYQIPLLHFFLFGHETVL